MPPVKEGAGLQMVAAMGFNLMTKSLVASVRLPNTLNALARRLLGDQQPGAPHAKLVSQKEPTPARCWVIWFSSPGAAGVAKAACCSILRLPASSLPNTPHIALAVAIVWGTSSRVPLMIGGGLCEEGACGWRRCLWSSLAERWGRPLPDRPIPQ